MSKLNNLQNVLQEKLAPIAGKVGEQRHIKAMTQGFMATMPLTILGGFALILAQPPVDPKVVQPTNLFFKFLLGWKAWSVNNAFVLNTPYNMTTGILGIFTVLAISYFLLKSYKMDIIGGIMIAALTFLSIAAPSTPVNMTKPTALYLSTNYLDAKGMFAGIIIAMLTVEITRFLFSKNIKIRLPESVPPMVSAPFEALIPLIVNVVLFSSINNMLIGATGMNIPQAILGIFTPLVHAADSLPALILILILINGLWFFGIHGGNVVNSVIAPVIAMTGAANAAAIAQGLQPQYVFTGAFITLFANLGGSGAAFGLVMAMLIVSKSAHLRSVGRLGFIPNLFGISEPLVFSTPLIMNPFLLIPMLLVPILNGTIAYLVIKLGIVGKLYAAAPWTTPGVIQAFLATMDWKAAVLWILLAIISTLIYIPFVKAYDKSLLAKEGIE